MPENKQGIPVALLRQLYILGAMFRRLEDGIVVFEHPEYWLLMRQFNYDRVVRVEVDAYVNRAHSLRYLFEHNPSIHLS